MAVDEVLLNRALRDENPALRLYTWESATLSLGYFQSKPELERAADFRGLPAVRRASGGGAILHDREWTYSLAIPPHLARRFPSRDLYRLAHSSLGTVLHSWGLSTKLYESEQKNAAESEFLCFARRAEGDLVGRKSQSSEDRSTQTRIPAGRASSGIQIPTRDDAIVGRGVKLMGSAQLRRRGALLQHGSVLMRSSPHTLELPGILDLANGSSRISVDELKERWLRELAARLDWEFVESKLSDAEVAQAEILRTEKYSRLDWNERR